VTATLLVLVALAQAGCGAAGSGPGRLPPLAPGLRIVANVVRCDRGARRFCGRELVVAASGTASARGGATALMAAERAALVRAGWRPSGGQIAGDASAASRGGRRYISYGPAAIDLAAIGKGNLRRATRTVAALRREVARHAAALSMLVETGTG